ncbi:hypothetical protein CEQ90_03685 [Lewinellaceae bacterium SD302]|nr:hypothetical protein CEQ90_03685 [Lewinellaceae bacterium SD302]
MINILTPPLHYRKNVPFHLEKSPAQFRADAYEDFAGQVIRQLTLHLGELAGENAYPWQELEHWFLANLRDEQSPIVEVGCGCGKLTAAMAEAFPDRPCYGFDFSYQLLKAATDYWIDAKNIAWLAPGGFPGKFSLPARRSIQNLYFGLARAANLPLPDASAGTIVSSFLIDRVASPETVMQEWYRVLQSGGRVLLASPLNWLSNAIWERYDEPEKFIAELAGEQWTVVRHPTLSLVEPLDRRGNAVHWNCECMVWTKVG